ncbi:MAG: Mammalian cell entry related domain protein [Solirubrobacterales bacterium]|nr:Mammalian cell entry related domain protein [Solirubrobacterales bacterium]
MSSLSQRIGGRSAVIGLVMLTIVGVLVVGNFTGIVRGLFAKRGTSEVVAILPSSQQLRTGNYVRTRGVEVGTIKQLDSVDGGRATRVTMLVKKSAGPLHKDAHVSLRWRTVLGSAFYLDLDPGHATDGPLSGPIPRTQTTNQVELDDVTSIFSGGARTGLQSIPGELSQAFRDHDVPGRLLNDVADASPAITKGVGALRGEQKDADLQHLVRSTARLTDTLARSQGDLGRVVSGAAATLQTTGDHGAAIQASLDLAPGVLVRTNTTVRRLDATLRIADPVVQELRPGAAKLGPTLRQLNPTVRQADGLLSTAVPLLKDLRPTGRSLARTARKGDPLLRELDPTLNRVGDTILPYLARKDPGTQQTTTNLIGGFAASWGGGFAGQRDANGGLLRFALTAGSAPFYLPCQTYVNNPDKTKQVECESLQKTLQRVFSYNPIAPAPGTGESGLPPSDAPTPKGGR